MFHITDSNFSTWISKHIYLSYDAFTKKVVHALYQLVGLGKKWMYLFWDFISFLHTIESFNPHDDFNMLDVKQFVRFLK